jgi:hypothetical protein
MVIKQQFEDENKRNDDGLMFKEHRDFFTNFFSKRDLFLASFAQARYDFEELQESFNILIYLIESTSAYILKYDKEETIDKAVEEITILIKDKKNHNNIFRKIKTLHRKVSDYQVKSEILPKPILAEENEADNFWKKEENAAMREMKKAFYDTVMKY